MSWLVRKAKQDHKDGCGMNSGQALKANRPWLLWLSPSWPISLENRHSLCSISGSNNKKLAGSQLHSRRSGVHYRYVGNKSMPTLNASRWTSACVTSAGATTMTWFLVCISYFYFYQIYRYASLIRGRPWLAWKYLEMCWVQRDIQLSPIAQLLQHCGKWPEPKSVMDNASFHHSGRIVLMCADAGVKLVYLPPYSPDLNPIEDFFAEL